MSLRKLIGCVLSVVIVGAAPGLTGADAQVASEAKPAAAAKDAKTPDGGVPRYIRPETPEQRKERLATQDDPGLDPDPEIVWRRFGREYKIVKFEKRWAKYTDRPGFVKPFAFANFTEELYQENDKYVWVWMDLTTNPETTVEEKEAAQYRKLDEKQLEFIQSIREEFTPLEPPKSDVRLRFENSSAGLPVDGSWRNSLAVADMNGDGFADIVLPPERAGRTTPSIFLGDGKGGWKFWPTKWPSRLNYGSVVAADFDKDKHMDLAFGIHLSGIAIFLHDGKGNFREVERTTNYPTRRLLARDVDNDGWMDVVAISEGPVQRGKELKGAGYSNLRALLNRKKGQSWEGLNIADTTKRISGDWLASGDFNGDKLPDFAGSTIFFNGVDTMYLSKGGNKYEPVPGGNDTIPFLSYYWAATAGKFTAKDRDDAIVSFTRRWVDRLDPKIVPMPPLDHVVGIDRITFTGDEPKRVPIVRWGGKSVTNVTGVNHGDFDGDGKEDLVYSRGDTRQIYILLGDGRGGFREAAVEGLELGTQHHYDLTVADVNGDKRPDIVMMFEAESGTSFSRKNGKVEVFLNRGPVKGK
jgi:hypothetical protein